MRSDIAELLARVEAATGPDRELSRDILTSVGGWSYEKRSRDAKTWMYGPRGERRDAPGMGPFTAPHVTASIDATVALIEKELPGCGWDVRNDGVAHVENANRTAAPSIAATPPLALLLAFLRAIQNKEATDA